MCAGSYPHTHPDNRPNVAVPRPSAVENFQFLSAGRPFQESSFLFFLGDVQEELRIADPIARQVALQSVISSNRSRQMCLVTKEVQFLFLQQLGMDSHHRTSS